MKKNINKNDSDDITQFEVELASHSKSSASKEVPLSYDLFDLSHSPVTNFSYSHSIEAEMYRLRIKESNYRKSDGIGYLYNAHPLQKLRSSLARGHFTDSKNYLEFHKKEDILVNSACNTSISPHRGGEWILEELRLAAYERRWEYILEQTINQSDQQWMPLTRISVLQIKALSFFELGHTNEALKIIELIISLSSLYPKAQGIFYAKVLQVKIYAFIGDFQSAENLRNKLMEELKINFDNGLNGYLTLMRLDSSLKRLKKENPQFEILATLRLCQIMGDSYYEALSRIELLLSILSVEQLELDMKNNLSIQYPQNSFTDFLIQEFSKDIQQFKGIEKLWDDLRSKSKKITSQELNNQRQFNLKNLEQIYHSAITADYILIKQEGINLQLQPFCTKTQEANGLLWRAVDYISKNQQLDTPTQYKNNLTEELIYSSRVTKELLFNHLYPGLTYRKHSHDNLIFQIARRIRSLLGIPLILKKDLFYIPKCHF